MSYSLPRRIKLQNPTFSDKVENELKTKLPNIESEPLINVKAEVEIFTCFNINSKIELDIAKLSDIKQTIIDCATFAADLWMETDLVTNDDLSLLDLRYAVVRFQIPNITLSDFQVELDFSTKVTKIK